MVSNYTRIKICGITSVEDGLAVAGAGADAVGLVFYPPSPRAVDIVTAAAIARAVGPFVTTVALFVNPEPELVQEVIDKVRPSLLQFHGDEDNSFCARFGHPFLKAIRVGPATDVAATADAFPAAAGLLFDAWNPKLYGGTGSTFEWQRLEGIGGFPLILAGGLTPANVEAAVQSVVPYGVDVSGGVESAKGIKDHTLVTQFIAAVRRADEQKNGKLRAN